MRLVELEPKWIHPDVNEGDLYQFGEEIPAEAPPANAGAEPK